MIKRVLAVCGAIACAAAPAAGQFSLSYRSEGVAIRAGGGYYPGCGSGYYPPTTCRPVYQPVYNRGVRLDPYSCRSEPVVTRTSSFRVRTGTPALTRFVRGATDPWDVRTGYGGGSFVRTTSVCEPTFVISDPTLRVDNAAAVRTYRRDTPVVVAPARHPDGCGCTVCVPTGVVRVVGNGYSTGYSPVVNNYYVSGATQAQAQQVQATPAVQLTSAETAREYHRRGDLEDAIAWYKRAIIESGNNDQLARRDQALAMIEGGDSRGGVEMLADALRRDPLLVELPIDPTLFGEGSRRWRATVNRATVFARSARTGEAWLAVVLMLEADNRPTAAQQALRYAVDAGLEPALSRPLEEVTR